ncbi:MAG: universal stress protein [Anderseniella sp.]|jgi:nucleotide-binding universal stress UspA family protein
MATIVNIEVAHMFKIIVVAIDGSEQAEHALATACDIAGKYKSDIHLVHSPELETAAIAVGSGAVAIPPSPEKVAEAGKEVMAQAVEQAKAQGCAPAECVIGDGDPADDILQQAEKSGADLIITGRRGLGGLASLLLGSVSHKVSQNAPCTCMTVK